MSSILEASGLPFTWKPTRALLHFPDLYEMQCLYVIKGVDEKSPITRRLMLDLSPDILEKVFPDPQTIGVLTVMYSWVPFSVSV